MDTAFYGYELGFKKTFDYFYTLCNYFWIWAQIKFKLIECKVEKQDDVNYQLFFLSKSKEMK